MSEILIKNVGMVPPKVTERFEQLYDLIQNESKDGRLEAEKVAKYIGRNVDWFRSAINSGTVPFAFASGKQERATSYIGILPLWQYETQCNLFMIQQMMLGM